MGIIPRQYTWYWRIQYEEIPTSVFWRIAIKQMNGRTHKNNSKVLPPSNGVNYIWDFDYCMKWKDGFKLAMIGWKVSFSLLSSSNGMFVPVYTRTLPCDLKLLFKTSLRFKLVGQPKDRKQGTILFPIKAHFPTEIWWSLNKQIKITITYSYILNSGYT